MTKARAKEILIDNLRELQWCIPLGLTLGEVVEAAINCCGSLELDMIEYKYFGLHRLPGETDASFRSRIFDHIVNYIDNAPVKKSCDHLWKLYEGFTKTYEYCIHCDEKKQ